MKTYLITDKNKNEKIPEGCMPQRADFAFTFICHAEVDGEKGLITYDYNPVWQQWYPFYDDVNKQAVLHEFKGSTFADLINEFEKTIKINSGYQQAKAKERFSEIFDTTFEFKALKTNSVVWELKYSKSQNIWTLYKIYNHLITSVKEPGKLIKPKNMKYKLINTNKIESSGLVTNIAGIYEQIKKEVESNTIKV